MPRPVASSVVALLVAVVATACAGPTPRPAPRLTGTKVLGEMTLAEHQRFCSWARERTYPHIDVADGHRFHCAVKGHMEARQAHVASGDATVNPNAYHEVCRREAASCVDKTSYYAESNRGEAVAIVMRNVCHLARPSCRATVDELAACVKELETRVEARVTAVNRCLIAAPGSVERRSLGWKGAGGPCAVIAQKCPGYLAGAATR